MKRHFWRGLGMVLVLGLAFLDGAPGSEGQPLPAAAPPAVPPASAPTPYSPQKWEGEIARYEAQDKKAPPPPGGILFVGSSSIAKWKTVKADFPGLPVIPRGFGGSRVADSTYFAGRIVVPYRPKTIVFYAGDNDIAAGLTPEVVANNFKAFVARVRKDLPATQTRILFISLKPSPSRWHLRDKVQEANRLIREWTATQKNVTFIDVWPLMLGPDGMPRPELYVADKLHMTSAGYAIWRATLDPYLRTTPQNP